MFYESDADRYAVYCCRCAGYRCRCAVKVGDALWLKRGHGFKFPYRFKLTHIMWKCSNPFNSLILNYSQNIFNLITQNISMSFRFQLESTNYSWCSLMFYRPPPYHDAPRDVLMNGVSRKNKEWYLKYYYQGCAARWFIYKQLAHGHCLNFFKILETSKTIS